MDDLAGLNCDEKAKDAGYEEGTEDYQKRLKNAINPQVKTHVSWICF